MSDRPVEKLSAATADLANEICDSLLHGDHLTLSRPRLRGVLGLLMIHFASLRRHTLEYPQAPSSLLIVVANPVAHGSRLAEATRAASGPSARLVADSRVASPGLAPVLHFPGLGLRSIGPQVTATRLRWAWRLSRAAPRTSWTSIPARGAYRRYLFLAQAIRYAAAPVALRAWRAPLVTDFDRAAYARPLVRAARAAGLPSATLFHGSPTARNYLPVLADIAFAWGEAQKAWIDRLSPGTAVEVVGRPDLEASSEANSEADRLVICHSRELLSDGELARLLSLVSEAHSRRMSTLLRVHPIDTSSSISAAWHQLAARVEQTYVGRDSLVAALRPTDILVTVSSSAAVEALVAGVPAIIAADPDRLLPCDLEEVREHMPATLADVIAAGKAPVRALAERLVTATGSTASVALESAIQRLLNRSTAGSR